MAQVQALAGRVAIVTGAANGMGRVMARALAGAGAKVAGVDVDAGGLDRLAAEPVFAGKFLNAIANVSKAADCRHAVEQALGTFGALDILINCAGISMSTAAGHKAARIKFFEADPEGWQRIVAINAIGAFLMARFAAEPMIKRGWGRIIPDISQRPNSVTQDAASVTCWPGINGRVAAWPTVKRAAR